METEIASGAFSSDVTVYCHRDSKTEAWAANNGNTIIFLDELDTLSLPECLTAIEDEAFSGLACQAVIIPDGCKSIGARAFANCSNLVYVYIPASVTEIAGDAFAGCDQAIIDRAGD